MHTTHKTNTEGPPGCGLVSSPTFMVMLINCGRLSIYCGAKTSITDGLRDNLDANRGGNEDSLLGAVDGEAACLAEATADALFG